MFSFGNCHDCFWKSTPVEMGGYNDYCMLPPNSEDVVAGICHKQSVNESMPTGWIIYITVADLEASKARCVELGGKILVETRDLGAAGKMSVIEDPAGAVSALFEQPPDKAA